MKDYFDWDVLNREFSHEERERLAKEGKAMPDGSYPIVTEEDLRNAIQAIGRAKNPEATKRHIRKRARALDREELIPEEWGGAENKVARNERNVLTRPLARLQAGRTDWYRIENALTGRPEVYIYDEIGYFGTASNAFVKDIAMLQDVDELIVNVNSPGGDVFEGIAIYQALLDHPSNVVVKVNGLAASIASVIAMAGDRIVMGSRSSLMIHEGFTFASGDSATMRKTAELLDRVSDNIASIYAERAGGDPAAWRNRMREETWFNAEEAMSAGLADEIEGRKPKTAEEPFDMSVFKHSGRDEAPAPENKAPEAPAQVDSTPVVENKAPEAPAPEPEEVKAEESEFVWDFNAFRNALEEGSKRG